MKFKAKLAALGTAVRAPEHKDKRTRHTQHYAIGGKNKKLLCSPFPLHYRKDGEWREIDLTPEFDAALNGLCVTKADYQMFVAHGQIGVLIYDDQGGCCHSRLTSVDGVPIMEVPEPSYYEGKIVWSNVVPDFDIQLRFDANGMEWYKILHSDKAPTTWSIQVEEFDWKGKTVETKIAGTDSGRQRNKRPRQIEASTERVNLGEDSYTITEKFLGRVSQVVDYKTRKKGWTRDVVYPVIVDAPAFQLDIVGGGGFNPGVSGDALRTYNGTGIFSFAPQQTVTVGRSASSWTTGYTRDSVFQFGQRFLNTALPGPHNATVMSAHFVVQMTRFGVAQSSIDSALFGVDTDDAAVFAIGNMPAVAPRTTAVVQMEDNIEGTPQWRRGQFDKAQQERRSQYTEHRLDVTEIVQEIQARPGWRPGNSMAFVGINDAPVFIPFNTSTDPEISISFFDGYENYGTNIPGAKYKMGTLTLKAGGAEASTFSFPPVLEIVYTETNTVASKDEVLQGLRSRESIVKKDFEALLDHSLQGRVKAGVDLGVLTANTTILESAGSYQSFTVGPAATVEVALAGGDTGEAAQFYLLVTNGNNAGATFTWEASIQWAGGTPPTLTVAGNDLVKIISPDGGTTWFGEVVGLNFS